MLRNIITSILCYLNKRKDISFNRIYEKAFLKEHKEMPFLAKVDFVIQNRLTNVASKYIVNNYNTKKPIKRHFVKLAQKYLNIIFAEDVYNQRLLNPDNPMEKFVDIVNIEDMDIHVETDDGTAKALEINKTVVMDAYVLVVQSGRRIMCADDHLFYKVIFDNGVDKWEPTRLDNLIRGDIIVTDSGIGIPRYDVVTHIHDLNIKLPMYDLSINSTSKRYYTNGMLSHNTTTVAAFMTWMLCFNADRNIAVMANKEATAIEIVDKIQKFFESLPFFLKPGIINKAKKGMSLENGCQIMSSATTNSASIGFTIHVLYLDEFAHVQKNIVNNFWRSVFPTLSSSKLSRCIITSTPNGIDNKFYDLWDGAIKDINGFHPIRVDYWQVPGRDEDWAKNERLKIGEAEFAQEYELKFNVSSSILVKESTLKLAKRISTAYQSLEFDGLAKVYSDNLKWHPDFSPYNISPDDKFVLSVDTAEGEEVLTQNKVDNDYNVLNIFKVVPKSSASIRRHLKRFGSVSVTDCFRFVQVGLYLDRENNEEAVAEVAKFVTFNVLKYGQSYNERVWFNNVKLLVEMNFNGRNFLNKFAECDDYDESIVISTYHRKPIPGENQKKKLGYKNTPGNKNYFCIKGIELLDSKDIIINQDCKENANLSTISQVASFGKDGKKLMGIGLHDDITMTVIAIARIKEEEEFEIWLDDLLFEMIDLETKYRLNAILRRADIENPDIDDDMFSSMYNSYGGNSSTIAENPFLNNY